MNISREDRLEIINKLRPHLQDEIIGGIFGITRERVAQVAGRRRVNGIERRSHQYDDVIVGYAKQGYTIGETIEILSRDGYDIPYSTASYVFRNNGYGRTGEAIKELRRKRKVEEIVEKLKAFLETGQRFNMYEVSVFNYNLHAQMQRVLPYPESSDKPGKQWAKRMHVKWEGYELVDGHKKYA